MVVPYVTRGICQKQVGRYIVTGLGLASVGAAAVAVFYMMPRFRRYEQFFKLVILLSLFSLSFALRYLFIVCSTRIDVI